MKNITAYRLYLAMDAAMKRLRALGIEDREMTNFWLDPDTSFRSSMEREIARGDQPYQYQYGEVRLSLVAFRQQAERGNESYEEWKEMNEVLQQEAREAFIRKAMATYDNFIVARFEGTAYLYFEALEGVGVSIQVGQALCKRVLISEKLVDVPDPELLAAAIASVPKVKKVEAKYGFKCNDAEFGALA